MTTPNAVLLLDGATNYTQLDRSGGWIAEEVGERLRRILLDDPAAKVPVELETIIRDLVNEFDLEPGHAPSTTLSVLQVGDEFIDVFVLADSPVFVLRQSGELVEVRDARLERISEKYLRPTGRYDRQNPEWIERRDQIESFRNQTDGFWTVSASPEAVYQMVTFSLPIKDFKAALMMSDGVSSLYDTYEPGGWQTRFEHVYADPTEAIDRTFALEQSDQDCLQWPRSKVHDDKAIAAVSLVVPPAKAS